MSTLLEHLIDALRILPGVGHKSTQAMACLLQRERAGELRLGYVINSHNKMV